MINIEINGIPLQVDDGSMLIEAADAAGITIPRFCYHSKLSIAANCRMCLVEVEKMGKPMPACATPVTEGMKVFTRSPKAIAAQRAVLEFLLINHPLDCPVCDQGGECDLQEMAMGFGPDVSRYSEGKRVVRDPNLGPLIATDMTRCIHCTRCVRFGQEIAGVMELGATGRGEHTRIGTYVARTVDSELSGNVIDLCPVGALTSKPYRYTARPWEMVVRNSVAPHDCVGSNVRVDVRGGQVMRVLPRDNDAVNETWIADRDRFAYAGLYVEDRLTRPQIKKDGKWLPTDWDTALTFAAEGIKRIVAQHGAEALGAWAADWSTTEELFLLQKLLRGIGSGNIDHRLRQQDFSDQETAPSFPWLGQSIADLETVGAALLIGSNVRHEQPLIGHRLRKAALAGASISFINPLDYEFNFPVVANLATADLVAETSAVAKALAEARGEKPAGLESLPGQVGDTHRVLADALIKAEQATVLLGNISAYHPQQAALRRLAALIAQLAGARVGVLAEGGNSAGAWLAGAVPHRNAGSEPATKKGRDWKAMAESGMRGLVLLGLEPEVDAIDPKLARAALDSADFVVSLSAFDSPAAREYADVLLPIALYPETAGTFVNAEGRWQPFFGCANPPGEARPAWKLLRVMGNLLDLTGFEYMAADEVLAEVQKACADVVPASMADWRAPNVSKADGLVRLTDVPIYRVDPLVRRSAPLQATAHAGAAAVHANAATIEQVGLSGAEKVRVSCGGSTAVLPLVVDARVPDGAVYVPSAHLDTSALGGAFAPVQLAGA